MLGDGAKAEAKDPKQEREVPQMLNELSTSINLLDSMVEELLDRAKPISTVMPDKGEVEAGIPEEVLCELANVIRSESSRIKYITNKIARLRTRLQV